MKQTISILLLAFLFACNSGEETPTAKIAPNEDQEVMARTLPSGNFVWVDTVGGWEITIAAKDSTVNATYSYSYKTKKVDTTWRQLGSNPPPPPVDTTTVPGNYTLVYSTGYDTQNDLDPFDHGQIGNGSLSTTIFKTGPGSFKSVPRNVSSGIRSEVQYDNEQSPLEGIVEYDVYYDNFFSNSGHSLQWHPSTSGGSGTGLFHKGGKMQFVTVKSGTSGTDVGASWTVSTKTWHHMKLTYKFGNNGYIKVEMDGIVMLPQTNVQMGDGSRPYLKVGTNMWVNQTSVVFYDNLKVYKK